MLSDFNFFVFNQILHAGDNSLADHLLEKCAVGAGDTHAFDLRRVYKRASVVLQLLDIEMLKLHGRRAVQVRTFACGNFDRLLNPCMRDHAADEHQQS